MQVTLFILTFATLEHLFLFVLWWEWRVREKCLRMREYALHRPPPSRQCPGMCVTRGCRARCCMGEGHAGVCRCLNH